MWENFTVIGSDMVETYTGVHISVSYQCEIKIGELNKSSDFILNSPNFGYGQKWGRDPRPTEFVINPDIASLGGRIKKFLMIGKIDNVNLSVEEPVTGYIILKEYSDSIMSIEIQLGRLETFWFHDQEIHSKTEIQNIQLADGDVAKNCRIPIYMVLPRYFSSACFEKEKVKLGFEINIVVMFKNSVQITQNLEIQLHRENKPIEPAPVEEEVKQPSLPTHEEKKPEPIPSIEEAKKAPIPEEPLKAVEPIIVNNPLVIRWQSADNPPAGKEENKTEPKEELRPIEPLYPPPPPVSESIPVVEEMKKEASRPVPEEPPNVIQAIPEATYSNPQSTAIPDTNVIQPIEQIKPLEQNALAPIDPSAAIPPASLEPVQEIPISAPIENGKQEGNSGIAFIPPSVEEKKQEDNGAFIPPPPPPAEEKKQEDNGAFIPPPPPIEEKKQEDSNAFIPPPPPPVEEKKQEDNGAFIPPPPPPPIEEKKQEDNGAFIPPPPPVEEKKQEDSDPFIPPPPPPPPVEEKKQEDSDPFIPPPPPVEEKKQEDSNPFILPPPPVEEKKQEDNNPFVPPPIEEKKQEESNPLPPPPPESAPSQAPVDGAPAGNSDGEVKKELVQS